MPALLRGTDLGAVRRRAAAYRSSAVDGDLVRVRPGVYARDEEWRRARPEGRVVARARALIMGASAEPVLSHETAAAVHGFPLFRPHATKVHVSLEPCRPGAARGTIRHRAQLRDEDIVIVDGLRVTSMVRTVADVARTASFEQAVVVADAALRRVAGERPDRYDEVRAAEFRREVMSVAERSAHGVARASRVLAFADGRAQLPGESISRIRLTELGFRGISLQLPVPGPHGESYLVDFAVGEGRAGWLGEFDGRIKYADADLRSGRSVESVVDDEKRREDWIRGVRQQPMARWGWPHIDTADLLGARLRAFGIRPPR
ncbi:hypothetical protein [Microbacterium neungamense]|uniref:hypothetical protein n=1 Tax=Microbacterium neungamense TaxID=2810535 RepID=UPI00217D6C79|nr:hypothetical protein [Microbacterium neungamense]UWF76904.1 hypothetical protein JSY13_08705 [Microbacterium neungamense]